MRFFLGLILSISVSLSCDLNYEEVGGYKIGCPPESLKGLEIIQSDDDHIQNYNEPLNDSFFDQVDVLLLDNQISMLSFTKKNYGRYPLKSVQEGVLASLIDRWGMPFDKQNIGRTKIIRWKFKDGVISSIALVQMGDIDINSTTIIYTSSALKTYHDGQQKNIKEETQDKLKGF